MFRNAFCIFIHLGGEKGVNLREMSQAQHPLGLLILVNKNYFTFCRSYCIKLLFLVGFIFFTPTGMHSINLVVDMLMRFQLAIKLDV